ncbi:DUF2207 family protein [Cohnella faecalis]|uniref:DUF2207 domain-containing protein n=1 Tax=Cohnella faecalis TaxID=2315694 RepID=A0A398CI79_9BACL|nr:DUF2207 domain-containing protein [Cohnella faecalis]RIE01732.1 DUF2207 domain-containing protein [Cohnella faecalis]
MPMTKVSKVVGLLFSLFLLLAAQPAYAEEHSFEISEVDIDARIDGDGNMHVAEVDKYRFDGAFNGIIVDLNTSGSDGIDHFQAFEVTEEQNIPLRFEEASVDDNKVQYKIYAQSADETKLFRFTYSIKNVVQVYADTAELYWKFFDQTNPSKLGSVNIDVELPDGADPEEITAFGHGPLHGAVKIDNNGVVRYQVSPLPAEKMLEVRILFPGSYVPGSAKIDAASKLDQILEEERNWSADTDSADGADDASVYGALALLIANLAAGTILYIKFGKPLRPDWKGKYYRELPADVTPAVVSYLMKYRIKPRDLMATMADLVRKKHVDMKMIKGGGGWRDKTDYTFRLINKRTDELQPHETMLIDWFFGELGSSGQVSLSSIRRQAKTGAAAFLKRWSQWQAEVVKAVDQLDYISFRKWIPRFVILAVVVQFFGFWFLAPEDWRWLMFCSIPLLFFKPKRKRRTKLGQTEFTKWKAFKRFLHDYSQIASREPMAVHLWEHYFVYAIPLGEAKKMIAITRLNVPNADHDHTYFDNSIFYHYDHWAGSFDRTMATAHKSANSGDSDGSFSSGGGGGGGGGGRGAF